MIARLRALAARIDALSDRERALLFVGLAGLLVLFVYLLALQPLLRAQRAHLDRIRQDQSQLKAVSDVLAKGQDDKADPLAPKRARLSAAEARLAASEQALAERRAAQDSAENVTTLLREVLGRNRNLRLITLKVSPPVPVEATPPAAPPAAAAPARKPPAQFYRHSVEIEMAGSYLDLLGYLQEVQSVPWPLGWSSVELKTTTYPEVVMRATLFTVSSSPALLKL
ncbi:MAG: type II secretion system protein GspM [Betaproteobacteria bacterium]